MTSVQALARGRRGGVYRLAVGAGATEAERNARSCGLFFARVDLSGVRAKAELLDRLAGTLRFPEWFGGGWDALADLLGDLSWIDAPGWMLVLEHVDALEAAAPGDLATALDVLREAAEGWAREAKPFVVLVAGGGSLPLAG